MLFSASHKNAPSLLPAETIFTTLTNLAHAREYKPANYSETMGTCDNDDDDFVFFSGVSLDNPAQTGRWVDQ